MDATHTDGKFPCALATSNAKMFKSGEFSDLTIRCGHDEYHLHRAIVCPKSDFLAAMCKGNFAEGQSGIINLPDDDPAIFAHVVNFMYTEDYQ